MVEVADVLIVGCPTYVCGEGTPLYGVLAAADMGSAVAVHVATNWTTDIPEAMYLPSDGSACPFHDVEATAFQMMSTLTRTTPKHLSSLDEQVLYVLGAGDADKDRTVQVNAVIDGVPTWWEVRYSHDSDPERYAWLTATRLREPRGHLEHRSFVVSDCAVV